MTQEQQRKQILITNFLNTFPNDLICKVEVKDFNKRNSLDVLVFWNIKNLYSGSVVTSENMKNLNKIKNDIIKDVKKMFNIEIKIRSVIWDC